MIKVIKKDRTNSVLFQANETLQVWFDFWVTDGELNGDWNQYMFHLNDSNDLEAQEFQSNAENFTTCFELGEQYLIEQGVLTQDKHDNFHLSEE